MTDATVDVRRVYLAPSAGPFYMSDPGVYHTSRSCAARGYSDESLVRERYLEKAVKEGYGNCGICAKDVDLKNGAR